MSDWAATRRLPAAVTLAGGDVAIGELHLQPIVAQHDGPESPGEMLNRPEEFFPLALADGGVIFLSKATVAVVACATADVPDQDPARLEAAIRVELDVRITGAEYRGTAALELPPTRGRTLDFLNGAGRFFTIVSGPTTRFVNRAHVRSVRPLD